MSGISCFGDELGDMKLQVNFLQRREKKGGGTGVVEAKMSFPDISDINAEVVAADAGSAKNCNTVAQTKVSALFFFYRCFFPQYAIF